MADLDRHLDRMRKGLDGLSNALRSLQDPRLPSVQFPGPFHVSRYDSNTGVIHFATKSNLPHGNTATLSNNQLREELNRLLEAVDVVDTDSDDITDDDATTLLDQLQPLFTVASEHGDAPPILVPAHPLLFAKRCHIGFSREIQGVAGDWQFLTTGRENSGSDEERAHDMADEINPSLDAVRWLTAQEVHAFRVSDPFNYEMLRDARIEIAWIPQAQPNSTTGEVDSRSGKEVDRSGSRRNEQNRDSRGGGDSADPMSVNKVSRGEGRENHAREADEESVRPGEYDDGSQMHSSLGCFREDRPAPLAEEVDAADTQSEQPYVSEFEEIQKKMKRDDADNPPQGDGPRTRASRKATENDITGPSIRGRNSPAPQSGGQTRHGLQVFENIVEAGDQHLRPPEPGREQKRKGPKSSGTLEIGEDDSDDEIPLKRVKREPGRISSVLALGLTPQVENDEDDEDDDDEDDDDEDDEDDEDERPMPKPKAKKAKKGANIPGRKKKGKRV